MKIGEISTLTGMSISTLRYYDKAGLLPNIKRDKSGIRIFSEQDIQSLKIIECLKISGMKIQDIKKFMLWCQEGDATIDKRLKLFQEQEKKLRNEIKKLNQSLDLIKYKEWYYTKAKNDKTESFVKNLNPQEIPKEIQKLYRTNFDNF